MHEPSKFATARGAKTQQALDGGHHCRQQLCAPSSHVSRSLLAIAARPRLHETRNRRAELLLQQLLLLGRSPLLGPDGLLAPACGTEQQLLQLTRRIESKLDVLGQR